MNFIKDLVTLASSSTVALVIVVLVILLYGVLGYFAYRALRDYQYRKLAEQYHDEIVREEDSDWQ